MKEVEIPTPDSSQHMLTSLEVATGAPIPPLTRLKTFDADSWEDVTLELVSYWKTQYTRVVRSGGGGDMGRDVIAYHHETPGEWENYQCKHYKNPVSLAQGVLEIGKLFYYAQRGEFTLPNRYYFVAPQGISTDFLKHINDQGKLKAALISRWDKDCKSKIKSKRGDDIELVGDLFDFINSADFSIFDHLPPIKIIELHKNTDFYTQRFGATVKKRPKLPKPPDKLNPNEIVYTSELLMAFADAEGVEGMKSDSLAEGSDYKTEYDSARRNFYAAEDLEKFSRDWLPNNCYQELIDECYEGVSPTIMSDFPNGFDRYLATNTQAISINYNSHPLSPYVKVQDKKGMCHQLVNAKHIRWIKRKKSNE